MAEEQSPREKRVYELGKRLETMDNTRRTVMLAARAQLEREGYRQMTMASLAADSGVTRQTLHNLYGSKKGVLEALFDTIAIEGGMERMREVMQQADPEARLRAFVCVFCEFWQAHLVLFRRIHGIGAIDPDFGKTVEARNRRRHGAAMRIAKLLGSREDAAAAALTALTSFEFYDALIGADRTAEEAEAIILRLARGALESK